MTSVVCRSLEKLVRKAMTHIKNLVADEQHGFTDEWSCTSQLISVLDIWSKVLNEGGAIDAIYLDFQKAFDTVPHQRLLIKLKVYGVTGQVHKWIESFLMGRKQRVNVRGSFSAWSKVTSGIPQGSVLGPLLFILYINDLPDTVESLAHIFADDTKLHRHIKSESDCWILQEDLDHLQAWSNKWLLRFNAVKCEVLRLGNSKHTFQYYMGENKKTIGRDRGWKRSGYLGWPQIAI